MVWPGERTGSGGAYHGRFSIFSDASFEPTLLGAIRKHWLVVALIGIMGATFGALVHQVLADEWVGSATMLVEHPESSQLFGEGPVASPERYTADQVVILQSTPVASRALEILAGEFEDDGLALDDLMNGVEVETGMESGLVSVHAVSDDPNRATAIANAVVSAYEERKEADADRAFDAAITEFDASIAAVDEELAGIAQEIRALRDPAADGAAIEAQLESAIEQLLAIISQPDPESAPELEGVLQQLQTLQLIQSVQGEDPALASLIESRAQALERRSQLALRRDQLRVDAALTSTGIAIVSPARTAEQPVPLSRAVAVGLLIGLVGGALIAYALANKSGRFHHPDEPGLILEIPLLAEIPDFAVESLETEFPVRDAPHSDAAEAFRFAVPALTSSLVGPKSTKIVAVVGSRVGAGASVVAANLAAAAAARGRSVLLVDCDFGSPTLTDIVDSPGVRYGITDVVESGLTMKHAVISVDVGDGLSIDLLARGSHNVTAPGFFRSSDTASYFDAVRDSYDVVLVDVPSPLQVAYAGVVLSLCDSSVVVVPHQSEVSDLVESIERVALAGTDIGGYVYNRVNSRMRARRKLARNEPVGVWQAVLQNMRP